MKKLLFGKNVGETGGPKDRLQVRRPIRTMIAGAVLAGFIGCGGNPNNHETDAGNHNDAQVCTTPGIGSEHRGASTDYPVSTLGVTQRVTPSFTPIDCVGHLSAEETVFVQPNDTRLLPNDDLTKGKLAIHQNVVTVLGNPYDLILSAGFDEARLRKHNTEPFSAGTIYNIPSEEGDIVWQVQAINQATETVAGRSVMKVTFQVLNSPDRIPEETRKEVYITTNPDDYVPVYDAVIPTGARVNQFSVTARNKAGGALEQVRGRIWADPSDSSLSLAYETFAFDIVPCGSSCGTLPYADSGRNVTLQGLAVVYNANGMTGFTLTTGFFPLE